MSLTAVWIAAGVALFGALIAAGTTQWRQHVELRHDRGLADLAELWKVLDEAATVIYVVTERLIDAAYGLDDPAPSRTETTVEDRGLLLSQMDNMLARLMLRRKESDPVVVTYAACRMACEELLLAIVTGPSHRPDKSALPAKRLEGLRRDFFVASQRVVGSKIDERRSSRPNAHRESRPTPTG